MEKLRIAEEEREEAERDRNEELDPTNGVSSSLGVRSAILDIYKIERRMLGHSSEDQSPATPADIKSYADAETMKKLQTELEMMKKKVPIHDDKIKSSNCNVTVDVGNGQQQIKQNKKEQHTYSPN